MDENDSKLKSFFQTDQQLLGLKKKISKLFEEINACRKPEIVERERLINKYMTQFLNGLANPTSASFMGESASVLINPDKYVKK